MNEADIKTILSAFSNAEHEALDKLINGEMPTIDVDKRELLRRNFENNYHLNKRNGYKVHCKGLSCDGYDRIPFKRGLTSEEENYNEFGGKLHISIFRTVEQ